MIHHRKEKQGKALWTQIFGKPKPTPVKPKYIRSATPKLASDLAKYRKRVRDVIAEKLQHSTERWCPVMLEMFGTRELVTQCHHRKGRAHSLLLDEEHWLFVSAAGHRFIHENPDEARKHGWICEKGLFNAAKKGI